MRKKIIFFMMTLFSLVLVSCSGVKVESVKISGPDTGFVGSETTLSVTVLPEDATKKDVKWSSSDNSIATVSAGKVTFVKEGVVTITAKSGKVEDTHEITVIEEVKTTSIEIIGDNSGTVGDVISLSVKVLPENASTKTVTWESTNTSVAAVDADGKVTLKAVGEVEVIATQGSFTDSISITVVSELTGIQITGANEGEVGDIITLTPVLNPANANVELTWSSSNNNIATVDANGKVTLKEAGEVVITAAYDNVSATFSITVIPEEVKLKGLSLTGPTEAVVGDVITLTPVLNPTNATVDLIWGSSDNSIATVVDGVVTIVGGGDVEITARQGIIMAYHEISVFVDVESVEIEEEILDVEVGEVLTLTAAVYPTNATNKKLDWKSSDELVATVVDGRVTFVGSGDVEITAYQGEVEDTISFIVHEELILVDGIIIEADSPSGIVGDEIAIIARLQPQNATFKDLSWSIDNPNVATLEDGIVTLKDIGRVNITARHKDITEKYQIIVYEDIEYVWNMFRETRRRTVSKQTIRYYGATTEDHDLFPSIFPYRFGDPLNLNETSYVLSRNHDAHPNRKKDSVEWITVHDTGNINTGAVGNAQYLVGSANRGVSWGYTVGTDGWFKHMGDDEVSWHAGDGSSRAGFTDTGIPAVNPAERPRMTLSNDGYFVIKGIKTGVKAPHTAMNRVGTWPVIIDGTYHIPNTSALGNAVTIDGGNYNGIGIETSVQRGTDVWVTWHRTAQLVAHLLVNNDLKLDRVTFHNNFSNKVCPQTAIRSENIGTWEEMFVFEYIIHTKFSNYTFEIVPMGTEFLDITGRVIGMPEVGETIDYKLIVMDPFGNLKEQEFRTTVV